MRYWVSYLMDEIWERAVETALDGQTDHAAVRTLTLDGAVKCLQGRLPPSSLLERFENLQHLSIANIGVSSLEQFPRLRNLEKLILSDNRIAGGLEFLVQAGLESLRDLDLSNNRIQFIEDLSPLAQLRLVSLDLYECPVTRVKDYRSRVFGMIKSLKYLDKMDAEENERPESDDEDEEDEEDEEDDPGSGEIDGEDRPYRRDNGHSENIEGIVDADEEEESDADEEAAETVHTGQVAQGNGIVNHQNGYRVESVSGEEEDDEGEDDEDDDLVEVQEIGGDSGDEEDGVEEEEEDDDDDDDDDDEEDDCDEDDEEEVDNEEGDFGEPESTGRLTSTEGEIDGHEQGEEDGDDDGETGEDEQGVEDDGEFEVEDEDEAEEEDEDYGAGYLVQPVGQAEEHDAGGSDIDPGHEDDAEEEEEVEDDDNEVQDLPPSSSHLKRKRGADADEDDNGGNDKGDDDNIVEFTKSSSKKHH